MAQPRLTLAKHRAIAARVQFSMPETGNRHEKMAKSREFFKTLKQEEIFLKDHQLFADAEANMCRLIRDVYNGKWQHSSLGNQPPIEFEANDDSFSMRKEG